MNEDTLRIAIGLAKGNVDLQEELTRTKRALEMADTGLRNIGEVAINHGGSDWDTVYSLSKQTRDAVKKELGE